MKFFTKKYAQEQGLENNVIQSLQQELDPLKVLFGTQNAEFKKVKGEQESLLLNYIVSLFPEIKSKMSVDIGSNTIQVHVFNAKQTSNYLHGLRMDIRFIDELHDYDRKDKVKKQVGDLDYFSYSSNSLTFDRDGDEITHTLDFLQVLGVVGKHIQSKGELFQKMKECFLTQNVVRMIQRNSADRIAEITTNIEKELLGIVQSEIEMLFSESTSIWLIDNHKEDGIKVMNSSNRNETEVYYLNSIARKTCSVSRFDVDSDYHDKKLKYFSKNYGCSSDKSNIEQLLRKFPSEVIGRNDNYNNVVFVLNKEESEIIFNVKDGNLGLKEGKPTAKGNALIKQMQTLCDEYSAYLESQPKEKEEQEA